MRRILALAYHFPPVGGAGVQRTVKFLRYLPAAGYEGVVVTGPLGSRGDDFLTDGTLAGELPAATEVHRLDGPEPAASGGWQARRERWLRADTRWARWWTEGAVEAGRGLRGISLVYATMSPFESGRAAARLAAQLGVPWVADLRDPWALDEMQVFPSALHRRLELERMRRELASAAAIVMNTPEATEKLRHAFPELRNRLVATVPNGYDAADFAAPAAPRQDGRFRIVHTGALHTDLGTRHRSTQGLRRLLGGTLHDVDILPRSHVYLLQAVERLLAADRGLADAVEVHLAGGTTTADEAAITSGVVRLPGYLPHAESIALVRSADLLFLPMHELAGGARASIVPGKTYEYLASGRPILAAVPAGDARDLVSAAGTGLVCAPSDVDAMATLIRGRIDAVRANEPAPTLRKEVVEPYERRRLAARLADVFDDVLSSPQATRAAA
jgi:glycosyltransferase involved in cell wall biosynthesis